MHYIHTTKKDRSTARWSGGTTTQLAVFPSSAEFMKFDFLFRMSTATVEVEESTFTFFPGVTRHLMILEGELEIDHTGRYKKHLKKFDADVFSGEWPTTAKGKVTDFNLMTIGKTKGNLFSVLLNENERKEIELQAQTDYSGFYLLSGTAKISGNGFSITMTEGDFVFFTHEEKQVPKIVAETTAPASLIISEATL